VAVARAALLAGEVQLEVGIGGGDRGHALACEVAQQRAAQVGVQDDAGGVDHRAQREAPGAAQAVDDARGQRFGVGGRDVLFAHAGALGVERLPHRLRQSRARHPRRRGIRGDALHELVHRGQAAKGGGAVSAH
jgi:hypothetical protein